MASRVLQLLDFQQHFKSPEDLTVFVQALHDPNDHHLRPVMCGEVVVGMLTSRHRAREIMTDALLRLFDKNPTRLVRTLQQLREDPNLDASAQLAAADALDSAEALAFVRQLQKGRQLSDAGQPPAPPLSGTNLAD